MGRIHLRGWTAEFPAWIWCMLALMSAMAGMYLGHAAAALHTPVQSALVVHRPRRKPQPPKPFEFLAGGRVLAGKYRVVALYGSPDSPALGVLGEQPPAQAVERLKTITAQYQPLSAAPILPAFEIIATVASGTPTDNGNYSRELDPAVLRPWIETARQAGVYVVLDLQPGRTDFLTQAKQYESLLTEPNVGLALDPEWRLKADQVPLKQTGAADIAEVNSVASWLAGLTAINNLPQKLFVLHQFRLDMLPAREQLDISHEQLAYIIQMDGQGTQAAKAGTWHNIVASPPPGVNFGWKNFYDEDQPMLGPAATMQLAPQPWYISYQ